MKHDRLSPEIIDDSCSICFACSTHSVERNGTRPMVGADRYGLSAPEKKRLTEEEKEFRSKRNEIQDKLIKFATRIPIFMYLTDFREYCLKDVIEQLEPALFRKVTGLTLKDFSLLVSLGVFNSELMNDAVYKFKRYEDSSLEYTGIDRHSGTVVGLWDTAIDTSKAGPAEDRVVDDSASSPDNDWKSESAGCHSGHGCEMSRLEENSYGHTDNHSDYIEDSSGCGDRLTSKPWEILRPGDSVTHKSLGSGTIVALDDNYLIVKFADRESKFRYPSAFEKGYLSV